MFQTFRSLLDETVLTAHSNLGVPRREMPQIPMDKVDPFLDFLTKNDVSVRFEPSYSVGLVKLTQKDIYLNKVQSIISKASRDDVATDETPYLLSKEGYLLDGHHRYMAALYTGTPYIKVVLISLSIADLLRLALRFEEQVSGDGESI